MRFEDGRVGVQPRPRQRRRMRKGRSVVAVGGGDSHVDLSDPSEGRRDGCYRTRRDPSGEASHVIIHACYCEN